MKGGAGGNGNIREVTFDHFWIAYPRKVGKGAARKAWGKIRQPATTLALIMIALKWQTVSEQWTKEGGQYVPMPATYLNQERWDDDPGSYPKAERMPF